MLYWVRIVAMNMSLHVTVITLGQGRMTGALRLGGRTSDRIILIE